MYILDERIKRKQENKNPVSQIWALKVRATLLFPITKSPLYSQRLKSYPDFKNRNSCIMTSQQTWTKLLLLRVRELLLANVQSVCTGFKLQSVSGLIMKAGCSKSCVRDWTGLQEAAIEIQWRECKASDLREIANNQDSNIQGCVASLVLYLHTCRVYLWGKKF